MAAATHYFYNSSRAVVAFKGDDDEIYFLPPRTYSYVRVGPKVGFTIPSIVKQITLPGWWDDVYYPEVKPWESAPA